MVLEQTNTFQSKIDLGTLKLLESLNQADGKMLKIVFDGFYALILSNKHLQQRVALLEVLVKDLTGLNLVTPLRE